MKRKLTLRRVRLNKGGYTSSGHYYGIGQHLYFCISDEGDIDMFLRACNRTHAKEQIRDFLSADPATISFHN